MPDRDIHLADTVQRRGVGEIDGGYTTVAGERYYRIRHVDRMPPFFMSLVSASDLWMFLSSSGGLTAGRVDAETALFPYYTDDKLTENADNTGPKTILLVARNGRRHLWEPFSIRQQGLYRVERSLYKNLLGSAILFEEVNHDLGLRYRYAWRTSDAHGFVKSSWLTEEASEPCAVELIDGLQNLLPHGVTTTLQSAMSNLLDAYKRSELEVGTGLGLFALNSTLTDLAEPSESLRATVAWQVGFERPTTLLTSTQLPAFRRGRPPTEERDVRGRRGAYFVHAEVDLAPNGERSWSLIADVGYDHARLVALLTALERDRSALGAEVEADIARGAADLADLVAGADGGQWTSDRLVTARHAASALFNIMRGGTFRDGAAVDRADLLDFIEARSRKVLAAHRSFFDTLPTPLDVRALTEAASATGVPELERLCHEYLPLSFSRRHGDPSRPWNRFSISVRHPDGRPHLTYQGNWRDIFQNWEALAYAFPDFVEGMIYRFLNATTADGYNPYRLTRDGFEWEVPEPENPWANIGYWSDHQIVYLLKLLEASDRLHPSALTDRLDRGAFSHANVPYRIAPYRAMLHDSHDTIAFDAELHRSIEEAAALEGTEAKLLRGPDGATLHVTMLEKLLLLLLVKLANLVPEGGIWMNTQRPEWNDANNALVGRGLSVVTVGYLVRYARFLRDLLGRSDAEEFAITREVATLLDAVGAALAERTDDLGRAWSDPQRRNFLDAVGGAGSAYRETVYARGFSGARVARPQAELTAFLEDALAHLEHTLNANRRGDGLYHSYNLLELSPSGASIAHLDEMLEGQVAILSSGVLSAGASLELLESLGRSRLYRDDQRSYLLYPDRAISPFLHKNRIPPERVRASALLTRLLELDDRSLVVADLRGDVHFHGDFRNARSVHGALDALRLNGEVAPLVEREGEGVVALFEEVFDHASFTGRSGSFFAYEGLGSIYWHMVSKLQLAVLETLRRAERAGESTAALAALRSAYDTVRTGLGFNKTPAAYGAFPTDPYSHTPAHAGAQQPGMTGQVKEDLLTRFGELGVEVEDGRLAFRADLLRREEFLDAPQSVTVRGLDGPRTLDLERGTLAFTLCRVPIVYRLADEPWRIVVTRSVGGARTFEGHRLDTPTSDELFRREGTVVRIDVTIPRTALAAAPTNPDTGDLARPAQEKGR